MLGEQAPQRGMTTEPDIAVGDGGPDNMDGDKRLLKSDAPSLLVGLCGIEVDNDVLKAVEIDV